MPDTDFPLLTPQELIAAGQGLFGPGWRLALADTFGVSDAEIAAVAGGQKAAPAPWRAELIAIAQDMALRALQTANDLMWREGADQCAQAPTDPQPPRFA